MQVPNHQIKEGDNPRVRKHLNHPRFLIYIINPNGKHVSNSFIIYNNVLFSKGTLFLS
jgi:hypothetical protein